MKRDHKESPNNVYDQRKEVYNLIDKHINRKRHMVIQRNIETSCGYIQSNESVNKNKVSSGSNNESVSKNNLKKE